MSTASRPVNSVLEDTPVELAELIKAIDGLPSQYRALILPSIQRVTDSTLRRRKILQLVQEALSQLRLDMKYLVFDLEATRRERDTYKQMIQELSGETEEVDEDEDEEDSEFE